MARATARKAAARMSMRRRASPRHKPGRPPRATAPAYDAVEKRIIAALAPIPGMALDGVWPNRRWTHEIKAHLGALGLEQGHAVFADECLGAGPQWLFALCWAQMRKGRMVSLPLVAEIEWNLNLGEIAEDFDKLLQSTARHRLMIFEQRNAADVAMVLKNLKARVTAYRDRQPSGRYLFAGYDFTGRRFIFDLLAAQR